MLGVIIYLYFLFMGYTYACRLFRNKDIYFRIWMGGVFGNAILMMGIVVPAIFLGFTYWSHLLLMILTALPAAWLVKKDGVEEFKTILGFGGGKKAGKKPAGKGAGTAVVKDAVMDHKVFLFLVLPITLIMIILMTNHILAPYKDGGFGSGQCTFGDLQMHLGFITSIAEQGKFPPDYVFLSGTTMNYPFFIDMLSSSLYLFGTALRWAVLVPSYVIALLLVMGMYFLAHKLTGRKLAAILAVVFFFFCGGFGFSYFFEGAKADKTAFTKIFTDWYQTPTNLNEKNIRWSNTICDMIIPQRTTMGGWLMIMPALWLLTEAVKKNERRLFIILGALAGSMPMIHTHSFLGLGMICAVVFFAFLVSTEDKKEYFINWVIFGGIVAVMAAPQLLYWTFRQTAGNESFLKPQWNWVNHNDPYLWFYLKNWGIIALFAAPAVWKASKDNKKLLAGCLLIFIAAETVLFQPNEYDNNKLFYIVYMILVIIVSDWLVYMWEALKGVKGRAYLAALVILAGTLSGALTMVREYKSGNKWQTYNENDIEMAEYIKKNTPSDAVFLTGTYHLNPVPSLAGRNIYVGSSLYVYFHGMGDEYHKRKAAVGAAYSGSAGAMLEFCRENGIDYVYVGADETGSSDYSFNQGCVSGLEKVHAVGTETLYKVK